jgi:hypothetical protein
MLRLHADSLSSSPPSRPGRGGGDWYVAVAVAVGESRRQMTCMMVPAGTVLLWLLLQLQLQLQLQLRLSW